MIKSNRTLKFEEAGSVKSTGALLRYLTQIRISLLVDDMILTKA
jgi:hypothetical protein